MSSLSWAVDGTTFTLKVFGALSPEAQRERLLAIADSIANAFAKRR
jgi:hypothetical protein